MSDVYKVVLESNLEEELPAPEVTTRLAALFHVDEMRIEHLLRTPSPVIKTGLNKDMALKYQRAIERTGACCRIVPKRQFTPPVVSEKQKSPEVRKAPEKNRGIISQSKIVRYKVGAYAYLLRPFVWLKNIADGIFDHISGMIWHELMGKAPNYNEVGQFIAFLVFSANAYVLWYIPEYSYKLFLIIAFVSWELDRFFAKQHIMQSVQEIRISLHCRDNGKLFWRRKHSSGESDTVQFDPHEVAQISLVRKDIEGGAFAFMVGAVWQISLTLHDGAALLLDEQADLLVARKHAERIARQVDVPVVFPQREKVKPFVSEERQRFRKPGSSGEVTIQGTDKEKVITSVWNVKSAGVLCERVLRESGFFIFLLIVEGFMVKYGLLLNWLINPYLGWNAPDFPLEISFTGIFSLFAPEQNWKEWLKLGLIVTVMLYQGIRMSRKKTVVMNQEKTSVLVGRTSLASFRTSHLRSPLLMDTSSPLLFLTDEHQVVQLRDFQTIQEARAFTAAIDQVFQELRH